MAMTRAEANQLLDLVRAGHAVAQWRVRLALWVTGDLTTKTGRA